MELRIEITKENAEKVAEIIKELALVLESPQKQLSTGVNITQPTYNSYLVSMPPALEGLENGRIELSDETRAVGSWGQWNSWFPVKAVLRILAHLMKETGMRPVTLLELVETAIKVFTATGLSKFRGFPKDVMKDTAKSRLVWHFLVTAERMGLIKIVKGNYDDIVSWNWKDVQLILTAEGYQFAKLENLILDKGGSNQILTDEEKNWLIKYLKSIDAKGYKEYTFLKNVLVQFKLGNSDIVKLLENDSHFINYVKSWSRKAKSGDIRKLNKQIHNLATMFASSKIALLRELGMVSNKRNDYTVIGNLT